MYLCIYQMKFIVIYITNYIITPIICCMLSTIIYYTYHIYKTFKIINTLEKKYNSKILYVKDVKNRKIDNILMSIFKKTIISINDNDRLRYILQENSDKNLLILIKSIGGYIHSSDSMLNLLNIHTKQKNVYIPNYAMSAATLLVLACDNIFLNKFAALGPTDPQIELYQEMQSFKALSKLIEVKPIEHIKDENLIKYYENKKLYDDNINLIAKYLKKHKKKDVLQKNMNNLIEMLSYGNIPHHTELNYEILNKVINVNIDIPEDIMTMYRQMNYLFKIL